MPLLLLNNSFESIELKFAPSLYWLGAFLYEWGVSFAWWRDCRVLAEANVFRRTNGNRPIFVEAVSEKYFVDKRGGFWYNKKEEHDE